MLPRERILRILAREPVDRFPVDIWYTPEIGDALRKHFSVSTDMDVYESLGVDKIVWVFPGYLGGDEDTGPLSATHFGGGRTMWGTPLQTVQAGLASYNERGAAPLIEYEDPTSIGDYPLWPDPDRFDYESAIAEAREGSRRYAVIGPWVSLFEVYCEMRGLEQAFVDVVAAPALLDSILDRIEAVQTEVMRRFLGAAGDAVDMVFISDDMGTQASLFMSLAHWDRHFRDRLKRWCELIHSFGVRVFYHSDGAMEALVPHLIDVGIDILNPVQHLCAGMDMKDLKKNYGSDLVFHGGVDNQRVLPFGSSADVRQETKDCLESLGSDGEGFICCSCHNVQPGTPVDNILTMVETVKEHHI